MTRFRSNFAFNTAGAILPILASAVTIPVYLHMIGPARYGIISIAWILLGYFGFLDFGLSRATANALSRLGDAPQRDRAPVFVTAMYLNMALGLAGSVGLYFCGIFLLRHLFSIPNDLQRETLAAFPWMVPMLPLGMIVGVAVGTLESRERFLLTSALESVGSVLGQVIPLLCALVFGRTLGVLIPALLLVRLLVVMVTIGIVIYLEWPVRLSDFRIGWARKLFGFGIWVSVSSLITPVLDTIDQVLIGRMLGPVAIAHYAVPMNLALRSQVIAGALARTVFPRLSRENVAAGRRLTANAVVSLSYVFGALCGPAIVIVGPIMTLWVGQRFAALSTPIAQILMAGAWMNGLAFLPYNQLQAQGRPDLTAKAHAIEVGPFLVALWLLIDYAGLPGAALAWTLRVSADAIALTWLARCVEQPLLRALPALALMILSLVIAQTITLAPLASFAVSIAVGLAFVVTGIVFDPILMGVTRASAARVSLRLRKLAPREL